MLIIGIDDAGRGPLIGPMVLAAVRIESSSESKLKAIGARDSKLISHSERVRILKLIKEEADAVEYVAVSPEEIDSYVLDKRNLNTLEAEKVAQLINALNIKKEKMKVFVDCPSVNIAAWTRTLISFIDHPDNLTVICEHKADSTYPSVSAASILAKVVREESVEEIKRVYGEIGSGYPSDPTTKKFLLEHGKRLEDSGIFRKSWATWKALFPEVEKKQRTLKEF